MEFERAAKIYLFCLGVLDDLCEEGILERGIIRISAKGREQYQKWLDEGFKPTTTETLAAVDAIMDSCEEEARKQGLLDTQYH